VDSYEQACGVAEAAATDLESATKLLQRAAKAMAKASAEGASSKIRQATVAVAEAAKLVQAAAGSAEQAWPYSDDDVSDYLESGYEAELIAAAADIDVVITPLDDRLAAFPVVVQILGRQPAVRLDANRQVGLRPTFLAKRVADQQRKPSIKPEAFIETLYKAYTRVVAGASGSGATLADVYDTLTILPEARKTYSKAEFARDVFLLHSSGLARTRNGATVTFPAATGTKGGSKSFVVVPPDGMPKHYYGLRFEEKKK